MGVKTKEEVFAIMGKYYGNAYWREAIKYSYSEEQLLYVSEILDKINALGYNFSNLQRLTDHEDIRFVPIILNYIRQRKWWVSSLLDALHYLSYYEYTPDLIELYKNPDYKEYRWDLGYALLQCRHKKFISQYLEIVNHPTYGEQEDLIMDILCLFKVSAALPRLLELYQRYPDIWRRTLLRYGWYFKDKSILTYIEPYLTYDDKEYRSMAKKAKEKLSIIK